MCIDMYICLKQDPETLYYKACVYVHIHAHSQHVHMHAYMEINAYPDIQRVAETIIVGTASGTAPGFVNHVGRGFGSRFTVKAQGLPQRRCITGATRKRFGRKT